MQLRENHSSAENAGQSLQTLPTPEKKFKKENNSRWNRSGPNLQHLFGKAGEERGNTEFGKCYYYTPDFMQSVTEVVCK